MTGASGGERVQSNGPQGGSVLTATAGVFARSLSIFPEVALICCGALALLGLLNYAAARQDEAARAADGRVLDSMLGRELAALAGRVDDLAWWGRNRLDALTAADAPESGRWGVARQMTERYNVDRIYLFDAAGGMRRAFVDSPAGAADPARPLPDGVAALVARARRGPSADGDGVWPQAVFAPVQATTPGGLALAAAGRLPLGDGEGGFIVFVRESGPAGVAALGRQFGFNGVAVLPVSLAAGRGAVTLRSADGAAVGALVWDEASPGGETVDRVIGPVVAVLLAMGGLAYLALHRSSAAARAMRRAGRLVADANRELDNNRQRFRDFAEAASDWFWETGPDLRYSYISERLAAVLGRDPAAVLGGTVVALGGLATDDDIWNEAAADIAARRAFRDLEIVWRDEQDDHGRSFVFRVSGQPYFDGTGAFAGYRGSGVDVSIETLALVEARFMQVLVHDALDSISEGFVLFNADGRLAVCNERYRQAYPNIADMLLPGVTFEEVLRVAAERGGFLDRDADIGSWVQQRLERHLDNPAPVDRRLSDGRWYRISEHATGSGGVVKLLMDITELKERETELAGQSARLKATLDSISHGVGMFDRNGELAAWNEDFPRLLNLGRGFAAFGRSLEEFAGQAAALSPLLAAAFSADAPASPADGWADQPVEAGERCLEVRRSVMPDGGVVVSLADVTERQRVETALRDLAQSAPGGGEAFFRTLALALARSVGADAVWVGELASGGERVRLLGHVQDGEAVEAAVEYDLDAGVPCARVVGRSLCVFPRGVRGLFPDDPRLAALRAESYCAAPLFDSGGRPLGHVAAIGRRPLEAPAFVRSMLQVFAARAAAEMERLRTINALKESEGRYRQLVELAPYGIAIWDGAAIRFANSAAASILGVHDALPAGVSGASGLEGARLAAFFEDGATLESQLAGGAGRGGRPMECAVLRPSGERRYVELGAYAAVFRGDAATLLVMNDITERRRAEAELQRSQKMEAVGRMAGGIAHEFNNMLTAIGGFARLAERNPGDAARVLTCVGEIAKASDRAAALTGQLLDFSRRRVTDELESVELADMVRDLRVFLKPLMSTGVDLDLDIRVDAIHVVANPVTLNQALLNLAINARDAMPGGGSLTVTLDRAAPDEALRARHEGRLPAGPCAVIRVADNGCGIADDVRDRIWEPFFTTKELGKGTGLGLWMVYGTVEQAGGVIELETEVGMGSVFSIYLPEAAAPETVNAGRRAPMLEEDEQAYVLLVDDEESVRAFLRLTLEEAGCVVTEACDGLDALEKYDAAGGLFDAVVTDVSMPHMNGADLAAALEERNPELRILFLTGYASRDKAAGLQSRPGWKLLMKPIDPDRLVEAVRGLIRD